MNNFAPLYRDVFKKTNGFMLNWPLGKSIRIGDFFALRYNKIAVVGNIYEPYFQLEIGDSFLMDLHKFESPVLEPYDLDELGWETFKPEDDIWRLKSGCFTNYCSNSFTKPHRKKEHSADVNVYSTHFPLPGGYFFSASDVHYHRMPHFKEIHKELVRRLTTEFYNFHKIFLVTDIARAKDFSLGVSATEKAELEISKLEYYNGDVIDIINDGGDFTIEKNHGLEDLILKREGGAIAFKAKKLGLSIKAKDTLIREIYATADRTLEKYAVELIDNELFHLFPKIEINPANANEFFHWSDMNLEDVELFLGGGLS